MSHVYSETTSVKNSNTASRSPVEGFSIHSSPEGLVAVHMLRTRHQVHKRRVYDGGIRDFVSHKYGGWLAVGEFRPRPSPTFSGSGRSLPDPSGDFWIGSGWREKGTWDRRCLTPAREAAPPVFPKAPINASHFPHQIEPSCMFSLCLMIFGVVHPHKGSNGAHVDCPNRRFTGQRKYMPAQLTVYYIRMEPRAVNCGFAAHQFEHTSTGI